MYYFQAYVLQEILQITRSTTRYQDTTILCKNGPFKSNSFLLSTIFPIFRTVLNPIIQTDEALVISMPDINKSDLQNFFQFLYKQFEKFSPSKDIWELLDSVVTLKDEPTECHNFTVMNENNVDVKDNKLPDDDYDNLISGLSDQHDDDPNDVKDKLKEIVMNTNVKIGIISTKKKKESKELVQCPGCGKVVRYLKQHQSKNCISGKEKRLLHQCSLCDYKTPNSTHLKMHIERKHNKVKYSCHNCGKLMTSIEQHLKSCVVPDGQTRCQKCRKCVPFEEKDDHTCELLVCNLCGHTSYNKYAMKEHHKFKHEFVEKIPCSKCGKEIEKQNMNRHLKLHEAKLECPQCGQKVRELERHIYRLHTPDEEKKFQCQDCGKGFMLQRELEMHRMSVHLKLQPHKCRYGCDISYNDASNRNAHEKKTHGKIFTTLREEKKKSNLMLSKNISYPQ